MDAELLLFERNLVAEIEFHMRVNMNLTWWEVEDRPAEDDFVGFDDIIEESFHAIVVKYRSDYLFDVLYDAHIYLENRIWILLNVAWPADIDRYMDACIDDIQNLVHHIVHEDLREEMEARIDGAQTIQNFWRRAIANPAYSICRTRLEREFNELPVITPA